MVSESTRSCLRTEVASYRAFLFLRRNVELPSEECRAPSEECWAPSGVKYVRQRFRTSKTHSCRETNVEQKGIRGRPWFDFWGGVWMISEKKKIFCRLISRKKILARKYLAKKKFLHWKKKSFMGYNAGKKILHRCTSGKKFYHQKFGKKILTQTKSPIPRLKSQMVGP